MKTYIIKSGDFINPLVCPVKKCHKRIYPKIGQSKRELNDEIREHIRTPHWFFQFAMSVFLYRIKWLGSK